MPLSASVMINKEEVLDLLDEAIDRLPEELREARWLLQGARGVPGQGARRGRRDPRGGPSPAERMVQRTEVVKASEHRARRIIEAAEAEARRLRHECEDFCDQKLASFEIVLERTQKLVRRSGEAPGAVRRGPPSRDDDPTRRRLLRPGPGVEPARPPRGRARQRAAAPPGHPARGAPVHAPPGWRSGRPRCPTALTCSRRVLESILEGVVGRAPCRRRGWGSAGAASRSRGDLEVESARSSRTTPTEGETWPMRGTRSTSARWCGTRSSSRCRWRPSVPRCRGPAPDEFPAVPVADDETDPQPDAPPARDPRWAALDQLRSN